MQAFFIQWDVLSLGKKSKHFDRMYQWCRNDLGVTQTQMYMDTHNVVALVYQLRFLKGVNDLRLSNTSSLYSVLYEHIQDENGQQADKTLKLHNEL